MSYISKEKTLETLQFRLSQYNSEPFDECGFEGGWREAIEQAISDVEDMPDEDVRKENLGRWFECKFGESCTKLVCSCCGDNYELADPIVIYNYCPNCGSQNSWKRHG